MVNISPLPVLSECNKIKDRKAKGAINMQPPEISLTYEEDQVTQAIRRIDELLQKAKDGTPAQEFYRTMHEAMQVINTAMQDARYMRRAYDNMVTRVEIMERLLAGFVKNNAA